MLVPPARQPVASVPVRLPPALAMPSAVQDRRQRGAWHRPGVRGGQPAAAVAGAAAGAAGGATQPAPGLPDGECGHVCAGAQGRQRCKSSWARLRLPSGHKLAFDHAAGLQRLEEEVVEQEGGGPREERVRRWAPVRAGLEAFAAELIRAVGPLLYDGLKKALPGYEASQRPALLRVMREEWCRMHREGAGAEVRGGTRPLPPVDACSQATASWCAGSVRASPS